MSIYTSLAQQIADLTNAFNAQTANSKFTSELPTASLPLNDADLVRVEQNGVSRKVEAQYIVGEGGGGGDYDDTWILPEIEKRVQFKGQWVNASYSENDWVISGAWMGVAKIDTSAPFPPEPSGTPFWLLPSAPTWEDLTLVGDIYQGLEFYGVEFNIADGFRIWSNGIADESFRLFAYEVSGTGATSFLDFIDIGTNLPAGWNVVSLDQFGVLVPNQKYRLVLETHAATNTATLSDNWDWTPSVESPTAGNIGQTTTGLHVNQVSGNATDQSTFLDTLVVGDDILLTESGDALRYNSYRIISVEAKTGDVYNFEIILTASGDALRDGRALDVDFTSKGVAVSTNYNRIVDAWPIPDTLPDQIQGFVTQDPDVATSPTPGLNNNAYGLDLFYETYALSEDWFYIGIGEGSTNQSGGGDIQIVDNLTTQDSTVALSGNMGYVLDQKILALPTIDPSLYLTKAQYDPDDNGKVQIAENADQLGNQLPVVYDQSAHVADSGIHVTATEKAAITNANAASSSNPFATVNEIGSNFTQDEEDAITGADTPSAANVFVTQDELANAGGGDMLKADYDTIGDGAAVNDSRRLGDQPPSYYLDWDNVTNPPVDVQVVTVPGDYTTANKDADKKKALDVTGGASSTITLDSNGLSLGFEQQAFNGGVSPFFVEVAPGDTVLSPHATQVSAGYFAYYLLLRANTWSVAIGEIEGQGSGDMLKSIYDTTGNDIVDNAEQLGGKTPSEYAQLAISNTFAGINTFSSQASFRSDLFLTDGSTVVGRLEGISTDAVFESLQGRGIDINSEENITVDAVGTITMTSGSVFRLYATNGIVLQDNTNAFGTLSVSGLLSAQGRITTPDPLDDTHVGDRGYNDGRYLKSADGLTKIQADTLYRPIIAPAMFESIVLPDGDNSQQIAISDFLDLTKLSPNVIIKVYVAVNINNKVRNAREGMQFSIATAGLTTDAIRLDLVNWSGRSGVVGGEITLIVSEDGLSIDMMPGSVLESTASGNFETQIARLYSGSNFTDLSTSNIRITQEDNDGLNPTTGGFTFRFRVEYA